MARRTGRPGVGGGLGAAERFSTREFELFDDARARVEKQRRDEPSQQSERPRGVVVFLRPAAPQVARIRVRRRETPRVRALFFSVNRRLLRGHGARTAGNGRDSRTRVETRGFRVSHMLRERGGVEVLRVRGEAVPSRTSQPTRHVHRALHRLGDLPRLRFQRPRRDTKPAHITRDTPVASVDAIIRHALSVKVRRLEHGRDGERLRGAVAGVRRVRDIGRANLRRTVLPLRRPQRLVQVGVRRDVRASSHGPHLEPKVEKRLPQLRQPSQRARVAVRRVHAGRVRAVTLRRPRRDGYRPTAEARRESRGVCVLLGVHRALRVQPAQPVRGRHLLPVLADPHAEPDQLAGPDGGAEGVG